MESLRFADVFFIIIVLVVTFGILYLVNKAKNKGKPAEEDKNASVTENGDETKTES